MEQMVSIFWAEPEGIIPPTDDTAKPQQLWKLQNCCGKSFSFYIGVICCCFWLHVKNLGITDFLRDALNRLKMQNYERTLCTNRNSKKLILKPILFLLSLWWSLVYLCKQAVAVCDILLLQQLSFPGPDAGCLSLRGQLPSDLPVSLKKRWQGTLQYISSKFRGYKPFQKSNNRLLSAVRGVCFQIVMHLWLLSLEVLIFDDLFAIHSLL